MPTHVEPGRSYVKLEGTGHLPFLPAPSYLVVCQFRLHTNYYALLQDEDGAVVYAGVEDDGKKLRYTSLPKGREWNQVRQVHHMLRQLHSQP